MKQEAIIFSGFREPAALLILAAVLILIARCLKKKAARLDLAGDVTYRHTGE